MLLFVSMLSFSGKKVIQKREVSQDTIILNPPFLHGGHWVDSVFNSLSIEERIGQLFVIAAYSNKGYEHQQQIDKLIREQHIGGLIFFQGGPVRQANMTNHYQNISKTPLLISMDAEWGLAMRLDSTFRYTKQMMLGAMEQDTLIYRMGADIAEQCKRLGVHVNLAPVVDVNNNPDNPVINSRSFGELRKRVADKGIAYMKGMQDHKVLACAKHFPGHGDTGSDSHLTLPVIKHTRKRLDSLELYPFRRMIRNGVGAIMVAHLYVPALDATENTAVTLSPKVVNGLLKNELAFKGLVFTDALNMKGVSRYFKPGDLDVKALLAGNDILLFSEDVQGAIEKIKQAIADGRITQEEINQRCKKILALKEWVGLNHPHHVDIKGLVPDLNKKKYDITYRRIVASSLTLLKNESAIIPFKHLDTLRIASVAIGTQNENAFQKMLKNYAAVDDFQLGSEISAEEVTELINKLDQYNLIIVSIHHTNEKPSKHFGITTSADILISKIAMTKPTVISLFANPYSIKYLKSVSKANALLLAYEDREMPQQYAAQLLFGGIPARGRIPVSATKEFEAGSGLQTGNAVRFQYTVPEDAGINAADLDSIDILAREGISKQAYPGCQVLVAKDQKVIYNKSFGFYTYDAKHRVSNDNLYDLASVTKIAATVPSLMKLADENKFDLNATLGYFLPGMTDTTDYKNLLVKEILAHQAGLVSWIPFYLKTLDKGEPDTNIYHMQYSDKYSIKVAENLYIRNDYPMQMYRRILKTSLKESGTYLYSDLGYYFFLKIIQDLTGMNLNEYAERTFYSPLGMTTACFNPLDQFDKSLIVPTEYDMQFRKQLIQGYVHDPGAAMLGGVGGHAGLFSNANDLAKLMQMYLNGGTYGGERFLSDSILNLFTACQFCETDNRRGAGFDKPVRDGGWGPTCNCISFDSFGHSGFTGTFAWADPDKKVVYIFLSNRVYPDATNKKLIELGIRTRIMQVIYNAINKSDIGQQ